MSDLMCKIFGHRWQKGWAGGMSSYFGAVVINIKTCERCGVEEKEFSTHVSIKPVLLSPQKGETPQGGTT